MAIAHDWQNSGLAALAAPKALVKQQMVTGGKHVRMLRKATVLTTD